MNMFFVICTIKQDGRNYHTVYDSYGQLEEAQKVAREKAGENGYTRLVAKMCSSYKSIRTVETLL